MEWRPSQATRETFDSDNPFRWRLGSQAQPFRVPEPEKKDPSSCQKSTYLNVKSWLYWSDSRVELEDPLHVSVGEWERDGQPNVESDSADSQFDRRSCSLKRCRVLYARFQRAPEVWWRLFEPVSECALNLRDPTSNHRESLCKGHTAQITNASSDYSMNSMSLTDSNGQVNDWPNGRWYMTFPLHEIRSQATVTDSLLRARVY
ncbi:uncharacterized protein UTRI_05742 [Ustilago trichophora]|uniref:Uncharacterized protein n=1 Tax=Ustilago trichophora TaxID=86804 RepID=A0A5C3EI75_9BASI|nr:uncharacterized protein UTRI_05742 [Ustilago trichophora]